MIRDLLNRFIILFPYQCVQSGLILYAQIMKRNRAMTTRLCLSFSYSLHFLCKNYLHSKASIRQCHFLLKLYSVLLLPLSRIFWEPRYITMVLQSLESTVWIPADFQVHLILYFPPLHTLLQGGMALHPVYQYQSMVSNDSGKSWMK